MALDMLKATDLEKSLSKTIFNRYRKNMDAYISNKLKMEEENVSIPTVQVFVDSNDNLKKNLLSLYDKKMALDDTTGISEEIKILQATLFDGLVFGINTEKGGEMAIYTANFGVIFSTDADSKFSMSKTAELNRNGIVNAVRIDIEYTSQEGFKYKPVSLNKNTNLWVYDVNTGEGRFHLVPYIAFQRYMVFFKEMLDSMRILEVHQYKDDMDKVRYITNSKSKLKQYCDDEEFASMLTPEYFPLKGFFYAPVLGAPSTTVGRTRIDLIDVFKVVVSTKPKVEKPKDVYRSLLVESSISEILNHLFEEDDVKEYLQIINSLPKSDKGSLIIEDDCLPQPNSVIKYLHGLSSSEMAKVEKIISEVSNLDMLVDRKRIVFNKDKYEVCNVNDCTVESLKEMLKSGIYKAIIRKKDCMYSSLIVTNSQGILHVLYGNDYFGKYESLGTRLYKLEEMINTNNNGIEHALSTCGFEVSKENVEKVKSAINLVGPSMNLHTALEQELTGTTVKHTRKSSSNSSLILARSCFANSSKDFYNYLDLSKIVSLIRLG